MGLKRSCSSSSGICHQHRSLNLQEALSIQITADTADDFRTHYKGFAHILIHNQIRISLAIPHICVGQSMILLRQNLQTLGKQGYAVSMNGNLSHLCRENNTLHADDITDIHTFEFLVGFFTQIISGHVALNIALQILNVAERGLSHHALGHHTSGNGNLFSFPLAVIIFYISAVYGYIIFGNLERILSGCLKLCQLLPANL